MSSVSIESLASSYAASTKSSSSSKKEDWSQIEDFDFLQMLTTQLKYQDPLNPSDNQQFAEQMATFTTMQTNNDQLEALNEIKDGLSAMKLSLYSSSAAMTNAATVNLINKEVKIATETFYVEDSKAEISVDISTMDPNCEMVIADQFGNEVSRRKVTSLFSDTSEGSQVYTWDAMSDDGFEMADGEYAITFEVDGEYYSGVAATKQDIVSGVRFSGDTASVTINGENYPVARIIEIL